MDSAKVCVTRGMGLMDARDVRDWINLIDLDRLNIASYRNCLLGQRFGNFSAGSDALGLTMLDYYTYGFYGDCSALTDEWRRQITQRRDLAEEAVEACRALVAS